MALQATVHCNGYFYTETVDAMNSETIKKSMERFVQFKREGIIVADSYEDKQWTITDEVVKGAVINFQIDEIHYVRETLPRLGCSLADYEQAMRVVITSRFGFSIKTLQADSAVMRKFANQLTIPENYAQAQVLADLLALLPGCSQYRDGVQRAIDDISPLSLSNRQQRRLAHYQSYLRFFDLLNSFWATASLAEKVLYFPVWFWFSITGVLPLRPTECVLTPRQCITKKGDRYYLKVNRSRKKGTHQDVRYRKSLDYTLCEYPIPEHLAIPILEYISATEDVYRSDIDVLFCKASQFAGINANCDNDNHYTYNNLKQGLAYFYRNIIREKFGYVIVSECDRLAENEIEKINLGDMRHIAMIALAVSGGSPSICRELAGHDSIEISSHYYANLREFLDVLGWERYRETAVDMKKAYGLSVSRQYPVSDGFCQCEQVWSGEFAPCESAVDSEGVPGTCGVCRWYLPSWHHDVRGENRSPKEQAANALQQTCTLLRQAIEQVRKGLGNEDTLSCTLDRLAAHAQQYARISAIERIYTESEELL